MVFKKLPLDTWIVVDVTQIESNVVSAHVSRDDAEAVRDRRNAGLAHTRYSACIAIQPIAERMGRFCG
jgi:hypothetical protein